MTDKLIDDFIQDAALPAFGIQLSIDCGYGGEEFLSEAGLTQNGKNTSGDNGLKSAGKHMLPDTTGPESTGNVCSYP